MTRALFFAIVLAAASAFAQFDPNALKKQAQEAAKSAAGSAEQKEKGSLKKVANQKLEDEINQKLLDEAKKNQCSFKTGSDQFEGKCDDKVQNLFNALVDAKKRLTGAGVSGFKFEVSGHTDSTGKAATNKALSKKRAAKIVSELVKKGIPAKEIISVGRGSEAPLVKPDDTPEKKAMNRRYEIRVRLLAA